MRSLGALVYLFNYVCKDVLIIREKIRLYTYLLSKNKHTRHVT